MNMIELDVINIYTMSQLYIDACNLYWTKLRISYLNLVSTIHFATYSTIVFIDLILMSSNPMPGPGYSCIQGWVLYQSCVKS